MNGTRFELALARKAVRKRSCRAEFDILRVKHYAADDALGELVAHGLHARVVLALAGEADHDRLTDHPVELYVSLCRRPEFSEPIRLGGDAKLVPKRGARRRKQHETGNQQGPRHDRSLPITIGQL